MVSKDLSLEIVIYNCLICQLLYRYWDKPKLYQTNMSHYSICRLFSIWQDFLNQPCRGFRSTVLFTDLYQNLPDSKIKISLAFLVRS